jgi:hypothetical protein
VITAFAGLMYTRFVTIGFVLFALSGACKKNHGGTAGSSESSTEAPPPTPQEPIPLREHPEAGPPRANDPAREMPGAGATVRIPGGTLQLGSVPGEPGRDPSVEADGVSIELPAFDIDALPYPNDPGQPIRLGMSRDEAERACRDRNRRLCSEFEWERACKGSDNTTFPGGEAWDPVTCGRGELNLCATREGIMAMGTHVAEWTRDNIDDRGVIRGAGRDAAATQHRCAARRTSAPAAPGLELAFRCCGGDVPTVTYPREVSRRQAREEPMTAAQIAELIRQTPELERWNLREGLQLFLPAAITEVMNHGATSVQNHPEYIFTVNPVRWSPTFGEDVLIFAGKSRVGSWIAALYVLPNGRYRHASSFLLRDDPQPIAIAYGAARREVAWASCWGCGGESGAVVYNDENRVVVVQR